MRLLHPGPNLMDQGEDDKRGDSMTDKRCNHQD